MFRDTVDGLLIYSSQLSGELYTETIPLSCESDADKIMERLLETSRERKNMMVAIGNSVITIPINIIRTEKKRRTWYKLVSVDIWEEK